MIFVCNSMMLFTVLFYWMILEQFYKLLLAISTKFMGLELFFFRDF